MEHKHTSWLAFAWAKDGRAKKTQDAFIICSWMGVRRNAFLMGTLANREGSHVVEY